MEITDYRRNKTTFKLGDVVRLAGVPVDMTVIDEFCGFSFAKGRDLSPYMRVAYSFEGDVVETFVSMCVCEFVR